MPDFPEIKKYQLIEEMGRGGMALVYKAFDLDQRIVALKVLLSQEHEDIERFKKEFLLLRQIKHPNIVKVFDFGFTSDNNPFFSMKFIEGKDFKEYFKELDYRKFYHVLIRTLAVLDFLHSKDIIHGDIKPSNILISSDENDSPLVKFTDFGFAEYGKGVEQSFWKGTVPYLAPEIIRGEEYNHQVDLYSLGVMLYEVLTGKFPFEESDVMSMAKGHLEKDPEFPNDSEIPEFLREVILKLLKKDPLDRYYSAREVIADLEQATEVELKEDELTLAKSLIDSANFVGREEELSLLKELFEKVKLGQGKTVLLKGDQGIGKTRLLNEFKNFVQTNGGLVIWKIIPENSQITLSEFQNLPANTYPIVSIIDNFKKVNAEVLDSFVNLVNQTNMEMVLICIALDNNFTALEDDRKAQQIESILESNIGGSLVKLVVSPLKEKETIQLMGSMVNWKGGIEKIGHAIHEKTGGDPFLIGSLMGSLLQQRCLKRVSLSWELEPAWFDKINAPECYVSQIKERLKRLSPESLNLIKIASVLGKEFESDILREITGYSDEETLKHLKEIFLQRLVQ